jgi:hypothetical protein
VEHSDSVADGPGEEGANSSSDADGSDAAGVGDQSSGAGAGALDFTQCAGTSVAPQNVYQPADVVIAIDNTTSMYDEIQEVRANMNRFSQMVGALGLNMRIVLVSCLTEECLAPNGNDPNWHTICIDPPVGAEGGCPASSPDSDTSLPDFLHVDRRIESLKALGRLVLTYPTWSFMLRPEAVKHVLVISDDNDEWSAQSFDAQLLALDPSFAGYQFHSIYSYMSKEAACAISGSEPCCSFAPPSGEGTVYREMVNLTGGVSGDLCVQDFDPVFNLLADAVIDSVELSCEWDIPEPPEGVEFEPGLVNVALLRDGQEPYYLWYAEDEARCAQVEQGWYYDDPSRPAKIKACPQTCDWLRAQRDARVEIEFGCEIRIF